MGCLSLLCFICVCLVRLFRVSFFRFFCCLCVRLLFPSVACSFVFVIVCLSICMRCGLVVVFRFVGLCVLMSFICCVVVFVCSLG